MHCRRGSSFVVLGLSLLLPCLRAAATDARSDEAASKATDAAAITRTALDFEEGWYTANAARMARAIHPDFVMRHVGLDKTSGRYVLDQDIGFRELVARTRAGRGKVPAQRQRREVTVLDVFGDAASARIRSWYGVDYLQLARWNGRWVIVNVVWSKPPGENWRLDAK
jgi:hypothetical protein